MIAKAIIELLLANAEVRALVGNRVEPNILKQLDTFPAVYVMVDRMEKPACLNNAKIRTGIIEIGVYADRYGVAGGVIEAIRKTLDDFSGLVSGVGLTIIDGKESTDLYDDKQEMHVKTIEYNAVAQIYT
jgi:hypothetical protein